MGGEAAALDGERTANIRRDIADLLKLAGPVVLSRLGIMTMGLTDSIVVGRFSAEQLGFHALAWAPTSVVLTVMLGLLAGVGVMTARAVGEGRREEAGAVLRRGMVYGLWLGAAATIALIVVGPPLLHALGMKGKLADGASHALIVFAFSMPMYALAVVGASWLEALSRPGAPAVMMWVANIANLAFLLLFVPGTFGLPALGAVGGAWATFGARGLLAVMTLVYIARMREARALGVFRKAPKEPDLEHQQRAVGYGAGASNFFEVASFAAMNIVAGWLGALEVAAWAVVLNVASLVFMVPLGLSTATTVLVGRAYGARDLAAVNRAALIGFGVIALFGLIVSLAIWPSAHLIASAYTSDAAAIALAVPALVLSCVFFLPDALQVVTAQTLRARADVWVPTFTHMVSYALVMTPLAWFLAIPHGLGLQGIVWAVVAASYLSATLLLARFAILSRRL